MYQESLDFKQHIHLLGVSYLSNFLDRAGFTIVEVITDPKHHYQLLAQTQSKSFVIAVRTAYHPNFGTLDTNTLGNLIKESEKLGAIPHFAGLAVVPAEKNVTDIPGSPKDNIFDVIFNGIRAVSASEISSTHH